VTPLVSLLLAAQSIIWQQAPAGTAMHLRLTSTVGSFASRAGSPFEAALIAPVIVNGQTILPAGSIVRGEVKSVHRVGLGIVNETASLALDFQSIVLPDGETLPLPTRLVEVDNGREAVTPAGSILEVRSTGSLSSRAAHYVGRAMSWSFHGEIALWAIKATVLQVPEPEIYLPAGTELTSILTEPLSTGPMLETGDAPRDLTDLERSDLSPMIASMPARTTVPVSDRPSDLINVMVIGSQEEVLAAFTAAGWTEARAGGLRGSMASVFAVLGNQGDRDAPMSPLLVNGIAPGMQWEKGLNDVAKRHHVRLWKQGETEYGQQIWIGAATRDVDFTYFRPGKLMTHRIAQQVDHERDKVANDLAFTTCVESLDWWERPEALRDTSNATGDRMETDGRLAVVRLNDCYRPRAAVGPLDDHPLPIHGGTFQRILRRQIMTARSELIRGNPLWQSYARVRLLITIFRELRRNTPDPDDAPQPTLASRLQPDGIATIVALR